MPRCSRKKISFSITKQEPPAPSMTKMPKPAANVPTEKTRDRESADLIKFVSAITKAVTQRCEVLSQRSCQPHEQKKSSSPTSPKGWDLGDEDEYYEEKSVHKSVHSKYDCDSTPRRKTPTPSPSPPHSSKTLPVDKSDANDSFGWDIAAKSKGAPIPKAYRVNEEGRRKKYNPKRHFEDDDYESSNLNKSRSRSVSPTVPPAPSPPRYSEQAKAMPSNSPKKSALPVKIQGVMFDNLTPIPTDVRIDPPPYACYNCWQLGHQKTDCPRPPVSIYCHNCGRRGVDLADCPRCSKRHKENLKSKFGKEQKDNKTEKPRGKSRDKSRDRRARSRSRSPASKKRSRWSSKDRNSESKSVKKMVKAPPPKPKGAQDKKMPLPPATAKSIAELQKAAKEYAEMAAKSLKKKMETKPLPQPKVPVISKPVIPKPPTPAQPIPNIHMHPQNTYPNAPHQPSPQQNVPTMPGFSFPHQASQFMPNHQMGYMQMMPQPGVQYMPPGVQDYQTGYAPYPQGPGPQCMPDLHPGFMPVGPAGPQAIPGTGFMPMIQQPATQPIPQPPVSKWKPLQTANNAPAPATVKQPGNVMFDSSNSQANSQAKKRTRWSATGAPLANPANKLGKQLVVNPLQKPAAKPPVKPPAATSTNPSVTPAGPALPRSTESAVTAARVDDALRLIESLRDLPIETQDTVLRAVFSKGVGPGKPKNDSG